MKYQYQLKRSARRTLSVTIAPDNSITVFSPLRTPISEIEAFLSGKSAWLDRHISKNNAVNSAFAEVISYKKILVSGKALPLIMPAQKNFMAEDSVGVKSLNNLKRLFVDSLGGEFLNGFKALCGAINLHANGVGFRDYKSRWGCCDGKNCIVFSYKILMLPPFIQRYVAVHELCHTVHHDHSKKFWTLVAKIMPDYKIAVKQIKTYSFLNRIY